MITAEEVNEALDTITAALTAEGLNARELARMLKRELKARETKAFKGTEETVAGRTITKKDVVIYSKPLAAWDIRQKARMDAHKLRGDYPPERREVSGINGAPIKTEQSLEAGPGIQRVIDNLSWSVTRRKDPGSKKRRKD